MWQVESELNTIEGALESFAVKALESVQYLTKLRGKAHKRPLPRKIQLSCGFNVAESVASQIEGKGAQRKTPKTRQNFSGFTFEKGRESRTQTQILTHTQSPIRVAIDTNHLPKNV